MTTVPGVVALPTTVFVVSIKQTDSNLTQKKIRFGTEAKAKTDKEILGRRRRMHGVFDLCANRKFYQSISISAENEGGRNRA